MGVYKDSVGYKIELGEKYQGYVLNTKADIYSHKGNTLYVSDWEMLKYTLIHKSRMRPILSERIFQYR